MKCQAEAKLFKRSIVGLPFIEEQCVAFDFLTVMVIKNFTSCFAIYFHAGFLIGLRLNSEDWD
jgi:hypothetical protein